jgi:hypothetical protein
VYSRAAAVVGALNKFKRLSPLYATSMRSALRVDYTNFETTFRFSDVGGKVWVILLMVCQNTNYTSLSENKNQNNDESDTLTD